jgi:hypothetical protein
MDSRRAAQTFLSDVHTELDALGDEISRQLGVWVAAGWSSGWECVAAVVTRILHFFFFFFFFFEV